MKKGKNSTKEQTIEVGISTTSIRISDKLIKRIKECASDTGASVNSTICLLLDLGLKSVKVKSRFVGEVAKA